jgi:CBS domain containing-hemolysin-like protein
MDPGTNTALLVTEVILLVVASAIFSGLNITIMALDLNDLKRKAKLGNRQAKRVLPLRRRLHLTMSAILLANIATVAGTSLVLEERLGGWLAGVVSTLLIVIFGEVFPQALFAKSPLAWTSAFAPLLKASVAVTYVVSKPLQILLDALFPHHGSGLQSREELGLMVSEHLGNKSSELDEDEIEIMKGALGLSEKRVRDIMTDVRHTYWLTPGTPLDETKIDEIKEEAYSRIPIFNKTLTKCYGILLMKDLIDVDFDGQPPLRVDDMPLHPVQLVGPMTALDTMFRKFMSAGTHLIPIEKDDQIIGIVTIEDLLEEIVGHEIEDETDRQKAAKG